MGARAGLAGQADDQVDRLVLRGAAGATRASARTDQLRVGEVALPAQRRVDGPRELGVHEQRHAGGAEDGHRAREHVRGDMREVVDARVRRGST